MSQLEAKEIGARIALARNEAGMTQEQLTEMATFSKRALQTWEAGNVVPYRQMHELSGLLGRPVEWFLHGETPVEEPVPVDDRLVELADAVEALGGQMKDLASTMSERLESIEQRLPSQSAAERPRREGRRGSGGRE
jgi:transcriptional regulator with XRE-family HTH domain